MTCGSKSFVWAPALAALVACGTSPKAAPSDAGNKPDHTTSADAGDSAAPEAGDDGASEAGVDGSEDAFETSISPEDSGPPPCMGPLDCLVGQRCCANLQAIRAAATCTTGACPTGTVEVCGATGGERCQTGMCLHYQCTLEMPGKVADVYACKEPFTPGVTCGLVPDGGFGDSGAPPMP